MVTRELATRNLINMTTNHKHRRRRHSGSIMEQLVVFSSLCLLSLLLTLLSTFPLTPVDGQQLLQQPQQQSFLISGHNLDQLRIPETTPLDSVVHVLKAVDRQNENRKFLYLMTGDVFSVNETSGEVRLAKPLDRERQSTITVVVSVVDNSDTRNDLPLETRRRTIIVEDVDDSWPIFLPHKSASVGNFMPGHHQVAYQVELSEQSPVNSIAIGEILATDADEGVNAEIVFECRPRLSTNNACDVFAIESRRLASGRYSATIKTKTLLDYERVQSYKLALAARGKRPSPIRGMPLETDAVVNINIVNVQDEGPMFMNAPYSLSIEENLPPGTRLLNLTVQDGDLAPQRELSVIVAPGLFTNYFTVVKDLEQAKLWYLETNATIDREDLIINKMGNMFAISLLAAELDENGLPLASDLELRAALEDPNHSTKLAKKEQVTVVVLDLPDTQPQFVQASTGRPLDENLLVLNISESIVTGASIPNLDLEVLDLDQGINSRFNLTLVDSDPNGPPASLAFGLESQIIYGKAEVVLNVLNASLLDYENPKFRTYKFNLVASKLTLVNMLEVQVNIMDANDNLPEFERDQYTLEVAEGSPPGTLVSTIRAKDRDSGLFGKVDYMLRGPGASKFKLIASEGSIVVNDCGHLQCLDYETQPAYSLTYEAKDGGGRMRNVSVLIQVLDVNDHVPKFLEPIYKRELISDNLSSKQSYISPQLLVKAKDLDGPTQGRNSITYRIKSSNLTSLAVEPTSGLVYLSQPMDLQSLVAASSLDFISTRQGQLQPSRSGINQKIVFEAEVLAEDNGSPPLNSSAKILLVVKSNRDGAPQFKQDFYQVFVKESQPAQKPFFQVQAIDPDEKDSQLRYSVSYDLNDLISVNAMTGELSFKSKVDYDDFKGEPYNVTLIATDNNRPYPLQASTLVAINIQDVNDKAPSFVEKEYRATLSQGRTKPGDLVLQVQANDPDTSAQLNYSISSDQLTVIDRNGQRFSLDELANSTTGYLAQMNRIERQHLVTSLRSLFAVDKRTGAVMLRHEPDYSFAASISILVRVVDLKQEIFDSVGSVQQDYVVCTLFLQTHIDRNPIFAPPWTIDRRVYNVSMLEELAVGTAIFSLLAKDPTTSQRIENFEKLAESDPRDLFRVDKLGVVYVNKRIDYEELLTVAKKLTLQVKAINEEFYSVAELSIQVVDLNDNAPQFRQSNYSISVSESVTYPTDLLTVQADDRDSHEFSQVFYSISGYSSELFSIHSKKGIISLKKGVALDRDSESSHSLLVTASDCNETRYMELQSMEMQTTKMPTIDLALPGCRKSSVFVTINLLDENDNEPQFVGVNKRGEFEALTSETVPRGSVIAQIRATDLDEGNNGQVGYEIVRADDQLSRLIRVDPEGYLSANESLAGLGRSSPYRITIRAYDHGKVPKESYAVMLLSISDVVSNDGVPKFVRPKADEIIQLSESVGPSTFVYQVQAIDPDEESNGKIMYKFVPEKSGQDMFEIDPFTGVIKTQYRPNFYLDREQVANYTLIILAHDLGSPPKQTHQVLTIQITDVNDNEPYFDRQIDDPPVVLYTEEEMPRGHLIGTIQAIDKDIGQNALIGYSIIEGNENNLFRLSFDPADDGETNSTDLLTKGNNPCRIYSTGRLDREARESYTLTIKAGSLTKLKNQFLHQYRDPLGHRNPLNHYNASDLTKIRVTIKLLDINDNRPVFSVENAKSVVDSTAEIYSQLMVFRAQDADLSNPEIQYSIVDALYYSDSKFRSSLEANSNQLDKFSPPSPSRSALSMRHVFDIDSKSGILRNAVSLRPYIDGYFEVFVKADSGSYSHQLASSVSVNEQQQQPPVELDGNYVNNQLAAIGGARRGPDYVIENKCYNSSDSGRSPIEISSNKFPSGTVVAETDNCYTTVTKAIVFITHQRETFRFVFNKTKLNDRLDEFKAKMQYALEEFMFEPSARQRDLQVEASSLDPKLQQQLTSQQAELPKAEKVYLNTFNTDFYEREDGSMDFSTVTSCSQLVKFDDRGQENGNGNSGHFSGSGSTQVPNQVIGYDEVVKLLRGLNDTQTRQDRKLSLFNQYGLVNIERCLPDRASYRMSLSERLSIYFAIMIAIVGLLLALIVSRKRKSYEKNLKLLQRSKYQYMGQYATLANNMQAAAAAAAAAATINRTPQAHQMSLGSLAGAGAMNGNGNYHPSYAGSHLQAGDGYDGPAYDTWQL